MIILNMHKKFSWNLSMIFKIINFSLRWSDLKEQLSQILVEYLFLEHLLLQEKFSFQSLVSYALRKFCCCRQLAVMHGISKMRTF